MPANNSNKLTALGKNPSGFKVMIKFQETTMPDEVRIKDTNDRQPVRGSSGVWMSSETYSTLALTVQPYKDGEALPEIAFDDEGNPTVGEPPVDHDDGLTPNPTVKITDFGVSLVSGRATIQWKSVEEPPMEVYVIQRQREGDDGFTELRSFMPDGPGSEYSFTDARSGSGEISYLLCAILPDGTEEKLGKGTVTV